VYDGAQTVVRLLPCHCATSSTPGRERSRHSRSQKLSVRTRPVRPIATPLPGGAGEEGTLLMNSLMQRERQAQDPPINQHRGNYVVHRCNGLMKVRRETVTFVVGCGQTAQFTDGQSGLFQRHNSGTVMQHSLIIEGREVVGQLLHQGSRRYRPGRRRSQDVLVNKACKILQPSSISIS
jgi:hypothetical protein